MLCDVGCNVYTGNGVQEVSGSIPLISTKSDGFRMKSSLFCALLEHLLSKHLAYYQSTTSLHLRNYWQRNTAGAGAPDPRSGGAAAPCGTAMSIFYRIGHIPSSFQVIKKFHRIFCFFRKIPPFPVPPITAHRRTAAQGSANRTDGSCRNIPC